MVHTVGQAHLLLAQNSNPAQSSRVSTDHHWWHPRSQDVHFWQQTQRNVGDRRLSTQLTADDFGILGHRVGTFVHPQDLHTPRTAKGELPVQSST